MEPLFAAELSIMVSVLPPPSWNAAPDALAESEQPFRSIVSCFPEGTDTCESSESPTSTATTALADEASSALYAVGKRCALRVCVGRRGGEVGGGCRVGVGFGSECEGFEAGEVGKVGWVAKAVRIVGIGGIARRLGVRSNRLPDRSSACFRVPRSACMLLPIES